MWNATLASLEVTQVICTYWESLAWLWKTSVAGPLASVPQHGLRAAAAAAPQGTTPPGLPLKNDRWYMKCGHSFPSVSIS